MLQTHILCALLIFDMCFALTTKCVNHKRFDGILAYPMGLLCYLLYTFSDRDCFLLLHSMTHVPQGSEGHWKKTSSNRQVCETSLSCYLAKLQKQVFGMMYLQFISMRLGTSSRLCLRNELRRLFCMCFNSHYRTILGVVFRYMAVRTFQWSRGWLVFPILQG